jgi:hypothetical protein
MNNPRILVPSNLPTDPDQAKDILEKIKEGVFMPHPDHQDEIMKKLYSVMSRTYMDNDNPFDIDFEKMKKDAQEREEKRSRLRAALTNCVDRIETAEKVAKEAGHSYKYQCIISQTKTELLGVLKSLEEERARSGDMYYLLTESD